MMDPKPSSFTHFTGEFCHYDFGWFHNLCRYGQTTPPDYSLSEVKAPIVLFWSKNDYLADPEVRLEMVYEVN